MEMRLRRITSVLAVIAIMAVSATAFAGAMKKDIVDTAAGDERFKTLVTAVTAADLAGTLKSEGPFTVFAPTNDAFAKLPAGTLDDLLKPENQSKLQAILKYHVVPGKIMSSDIAGKKAAVDTAEGSKLSVDATGKSVMVDQATVILADIETSNGVIHVIDTVVLPTS
jgi:uncharacterized surface protein with fasciclin (FAS1) repeats